VFTATTGSPIERKVFSAHWYRCLRALGLRVRGIYCTKDTFVSAALTLGAKVAWLEQQTGVSYATLRRHYGQWMDVGDDSELRLFAQLDPSLFGVQKRADVPPGGAQKRGAVSQVTDKTAQSTCEEGDLNPHGLLAH
jgi:hypothetical protein